MQQTACSLSQRNFCKKGDKEYQKAINMFIITLQIFSIVITSAHKEKGDGPRGEKMMRHRIGVSGAFFVA